MGKERIMSHEWTEMWDKTKDSLEDWKRIIEGVWGENQTGIGRFVEDLNNFYGSRGPDRVRVLLNYYPIRGGQKGEPISNFKRNKRLPQTFTDILYWIGEPDYLPEENEADREETKLDFAKLAVLSILHEVEHNFFQGKRYYQLMAVAEADMTIKEIVKRLLGPENIFMQASNELVTTYLESYGKWLLEDASLEEKGKKGLTVEMEVNEAKAKKVWQVVLSEDRDRWQGNGPYTKLIKGWERWHAGSKEKTDSGNKIMETKREIPNIYKLARSLDLDLAKEYALAGRQLDIEFVRGIYRMVEKTLGK
jgi:hypothetical protein